MCNTDNGRSGGAISRKFELRHRVHVQGIRFIPFVIVAGGVFGRDERGRASDSYRPEIHGLRALAVLPVVFYHAKFSLFSGGYVGVDVFFVISGYLITGIIYSDIASGRFSIVRFYERRVRRIRLPCCWYVRHAFLLQ